MPPRPKMRLASRQVLSPSRASGRCRLWSQQLPVHMQRRGFADDRPIEDRPFENRPADGEPKGPNMDQLPHVSEEAAATKKSMGEKGPDMEQGTPAAEVVKGDKQAQENLPKVMKDQIKNEQAKGKRSFSTFARAQPRSSSALLSTHFALRNSKARPFSTYSRMHEELEVHQNQDANFQALQQLAAEVSQETHLSENVSAGSPGLKFSPPPKAFPSGGHLRKRYDTVVDQVTKLLMHDGKLSVAQSQMNKILNHLRTSPAPKPSQRAPLIENAPPPSTLPLNPILFLTVALDSVAPLFRIRSQKGIAGGGASIQIPVPLRQRQRRRAAIMWMLKQLGTRTGAVNPFPKRFADEIVAIVEGRSSLWERRNALHIAGMRARANLNAMSKRR